MADIYSVMTNQLTPSGAPMHFSARLARDIVACFNKSARAKKRNPDEGALLVEVLVAMLILVIVFTTTTISLSSMADKRVQIEQRDQALSLLTSYEEQSRIFRCGYIVDRIENSLAESGNGAVDLQNKIGRCDFAAAESGVPFTSRTNSGDQNFTVNRSINETPGLERTFQISIRYWWEIPGSQTHRNTCSQIAGAAKLPVILTRAFRVEWREKGVTRSEILIKRDPAPNDDVVFASGNRKNILVRTDTAVNPQVKLLLNGTRGVNRIVDGIMGQPTKCVWFPYITPDGVDRNFQATVISVATVSDSDLVAQLPQGSVIR